MSWARRAVLPALALALLSACQTAPVLTPAAGGAEPPVALPALAVDEAETRPEQVFRDALLLGFAENEPETPPLYRLNFRMVLTETTAAPEKFTGRIGRSQVSGRVSYLLEEVGTGEVLLTADARSVVSHDRAERDEAEARVARALAKDVRARLVSHFAANGS